jgi:hypothetical protein
MAKLADFNTTDRAEEGVKLDLLLPNGEPSGEWVQVRSYLSPIAQKARYEAERKRAEKGDKLTFEDGQALEAESRAALVKAWSFEDACTTDSVKAWLLTSQMVSQAIIVAATQDQRFFGKPSTDSSDGAKAK